MKIEDVKKLRSETGAPVMQAKKALEEAGGNFSKAKKILKKKGIEAAKKKSERSVCNGLIYSYIHPGSRVGVLLEINCETDFVAITDDFIKLTKEVALQVAGMDPKSVEELLKQEYIRDPGRKVSDLVNEVIAKTGENIKIRRFIRYELGG